MKNCYHDNCASFDDRVQCKLIQNNHSCIIDTCNRESNRESCSNADCEFVPGLDWRFWLLPGSCCIFAVARCVAPWPQAWTETLLVKPFCGLTVTTTELLPWDEIFGFGEDGLRDVLAVVFVQGRDAGNRMERNDLVVQLITISVAAVYNTGARRNNLATDKQLDEGLAIVLVAVNMFTLLPAIPYMLKLLPKLLSQSYDCCLTQLDRLQRQDAVE